MQFSALLITLIASISLTVALPIGISLGEDLKSAIAQKRSQESNLVASKFLSEEKRAYQLETVEMATFKYTRDLDPAVLESRSAPSKQTEVRPSAVGNRFDPNFKPGRVVENYEEALDVNNPGYVGLGSVVETLD